MNLTVSRLGPEDIERAKAECALFWNMDGASANLAAYLADPNCILLVGAIDGEPAGQIVGHILRPWNAGNPILLLYSVDVLEQHRRKGLARALITEFLRIGKEAGCGKSFVITNESNIPAMKTYAALGGTRQYTGEAMFEWRINHE